MKAVHYILIAGFFVVLVMGSLSLPPQGDVSAPLHRDISPAGSPVAGSHYIRNAYPDTHTVNIVTVVLADYRGFDTLGETVVVFAAGIACCLILKRKGS